MIETIAQHINELESMKTYPNVLNCIGNQALLKKRKISVVGTRHPYYYTKIQTYNLAQRLSQAGICIVSGGAIGVDAIAHEASGAENTILVSPTGLEIIYPSINRQLIRNIHEYGLAISMYENDFKATPWSFVARNELVVALGEVLIVTQADENSGSMRSVEFALKMGKKVYVLPHRLGESKGTNSLLNNNLAQAIYDIDEFVNDLVPLNTNEMSKDSFLEYCKLNPTYDEALEKYQHLVYEYELEKKIMIQNGRVVLFSHC
jgi:DNA processing protein